VAATAVIAIVLVGYAYVSMRSVEPPPVPVQRGTDGTGWKWSSSPTSAANTAAPARIGFRVTVVESVERKSPMMTATTQVKTEGGVRRPVANAPCASEPDAWEQHRSVVGNTVAPARAKRPAGNERAGAPPVQRRARREAMASAAAAATKSPRRTGGGEGLDDLAQRLQQGVSVPRRRPTDSDEPTPSETLVDAGSRRIVRDRPGPFACPEATRD
jgi:hypothetical protein